jgi:uncharacterized protein YcnI
MSMIRSVRGARRAAALVILLAALLLAAAPASAHVTVPDGGGIPSGSSATIHLDVPHGCEGQPTDTIEVQLPDGVVGAKAEWSSGWTVEAETVTAEPYTLYGTEYTERVGVIRWTGGPLPDDQYYDFGIQATFLADPGELVIPVVQRCGDLEEAWIEVPAEGQTEDDLEHPAPTVTILAAEEEGDHHGGVTLAALHQMVEELEAEVADLKAQLEAGNAP